MSWILQFQCIKGSLAQLDSNFSGGGGIRIGDSTTACSGNGGALRHDANSSDGGGFQYCDDTDWKKLVTQKSVLQSSTFSTSSSSAVNITGASITMDVNADDMLYIKVSCLLQGTGSRTARLDVTRTGISTVTGGYATWYSQSGPGTLLNSIKCSI